MGSKKTFRNLFLLSSTAIGAMHCINTFIYQNANKNSVSKNQRNYYNCRFGRIMYRTYGTGTPLLLIHDLDVCSSSYEWNKIITPLGEKYTIYALDLLGCGYSDKSNLIYTNQVYAQVIQDFILDIIKEPTDVISTGHSAGFTLMACNQCNSIIKKVLLVNPESSITLKKPYQKYTDIIKYLFATPIIGRFIYNMCINKDKIVEKFQQKYYYNAKNISEDTVMTYYEASQIEKTKGKQLYSSLLCGFLSYNISDILKRTENDITIVVGAEDTDSIINAKEYQNLCPYIQIIKIEHTRYLPQLEKPEEFVKTVERLL